MGQKVTFYPITQIVQVDIAPVDGVIDFDVKIDLYSDGKEDWITDSNLTKVIFPIRSVGGDPLPEGSLGGTFFLLPPWKIRPYESNHIFRVNGNLYSEDGTSPFTQTVGTYNVPIISTVSSIVTVVGGEISIDNIVDGVWDADTGDHQSSNTFGAKNQNLIPSETIADYKADVSAIATNIIRLLGLNQENYMMDTIAYNGELMTGAKLRLYDDSTLTTETDSYTISVVYNGNNISSYTSVKD